MRKEVKNDKVLRAIAVGIAAMMATSAIPTTVLANENPDTPEAPPTEAPETSGQETTSESSESSVTETASISEIQTSVETIETDAGEASDAIDTAVTQTGVFEDEQITSDMLGAQAAYEGVDGALGVEDLVSDAKDALDDAATKEGLADILITTADNTANDLIAQNRAYQTADQKTTTNADSAISNADTANTSDDEQVAYAAKDAAVGNLEVVEEGFAEANLAYSNALSKAEDAELEYEAAEKEHQAALAKVEEAKARLAEAQTNATAAIEMLKAVEQRAGSLERRATKLQETSVQLNAIRTQYYAMMVQYYRDVLGNKTVYHDDGTLDIEGCAKAIKEQDVNKKASSPGDVMLLGRDLMKKLVEYQVMSDENVDWETAEFTFGAKGSSSQEAREGIVFTSGELTASGYGKDQVVLKQNNDTGRTDINGKHIDPNASYYIKQDKSNEDGGRNNRVLATYKDKDGVEHNVYYNYVYKNSNYGDTLDLENGVIYLAEVEKDETGKWVTKRVIDENNFDNYQNLLAAIEESKAANDYQNALQTVKDATEKVENLSQEIEALKKVGLDGSKLAALQTKLKEANDELNEATAAKVELGKKVEAARKAVEGIDLSRFNRVVLSDDVVVEDEDAGGEAGGADLGAGGAGGLGAGGALGAGGTGTLGAGGATGGAAGGSGTYSMPTVNSPVSGGAAAEGGGITLTDAELPGAGAVEGTEAMGGDEISIAGLMENAAKKSGQEQNLVTLADEQLAGAMSATAGEVTQSNEGMNWMWLLIIALFGAAGRKMYEKYKERKEQGSDNLQA